jgi:hypothetical protein
LHGKSEAVRLARLVVWILAQNNNFGIVEIGRKSRENLLLGRINYGVLVGFRQKLAQLFKIRLIELGL